MLDLFSKIFFILEVISKNTGKWVLSIPNKFLFDVEKHFKFQKKKLIKKCLNLKML